MTTQNDDHAQDDPLRQVVELARESLRERGYSDEQIEILLNRRTAPEYDN